MPYKNKVFVSFDGDTDMHYYRLMTAWKQSDYSTFNFNNAHEMKQARDNSLEATIKRSLRERILNSKIFLLLVGTNTRYLYKYVRWEIESAIDLNLPIIASNLNGLRYLDQERCPPILKDKLSIHVSFNSKIIEYAMLNWPQQHYKFSKFREIGPYYYNDIVYRNLGLSL